MPQLKSDERPTLLRLLACLALAGCLSLIVGTVAGQSVVPDHDWIADTISDLAAGPGEIVMDVALYGFAAGLFAAAMAASNAHLGGRRWSVGLISLALAGALVIIVGARNEYGDNDSDGIVIHAYLVYGLGLAFTVIPYSMAPGAGRVHRWAKPTLYALGTIWLIAAPIFLVLPTDVDGAYERGLGLIACAIILVLARVFLTRARQTASG
ncbi:DUF998 domain-containing protein [Pontivivens insulae]|uniref:DUF998 domain-containing protein n=1 Tax=Pontivivens insulae TaxID=1639689 RepID=A0A2R8AB51_9RHOB|nr:DUF998 domain-containing protein [Pontivivens insulae]RED11371.1 uncharacterized protein DUF998 [Pontivivens insulae]SPF29456.1 hypothetical protein POI8812_01766 [Pontivivens insulae]